MYDPDDEKDMDLNELKITFANYFPTIANSKPLHLETFFEFLSEQLLQVNLSVHLTYDDIAQYPWKITVTKSMQQFAQHFVSQHLSKKAKNKENINEKDIMTDEATGDEYFHLSKEWAEQSDPIFLMNQSFDKGAGFPDGTVSVFIGKNHNNQMNLQLKMALNQTQFELIDWKKEENNLQNAMKSKDSHELMKDKYKRMEFLFRIVGLNEQKQINLKKDYDFCKYALTFDNVCHCFCFCFCFYFFCFRFFVIFIDLLLLLFVVFLLFCC